MQGSGKPRSTQSRRLARLGDAYVRWAEWAQGRKAKQEIDEAIREAKKQIYEAIKLDRHDPRSYLSLADAFNLDGDVAAALAEVKIALELNPGSAEAHSRFGELLENHSDEEARIEYRTAIALDPTLPTPHVQLAENLAKAGRAEEAEFEDQRAMQLDPTDLPYSRSVHDNLVVAEYDRWLRDRPDDVEAHIEIGALLFARDRVKEASDEYSTAARLEPGNPLAHRGLAAALYELGKEKKAANEYRKYRRLIEMFGMPGQNQKYSRNTR